MGLGLDPPFHSPIKVKFMKTCDRENLGKSRKSIHENNKEHEKEHHRGQDLGNQPPIPTHVLIVPRQLGVGSLDVCLGVQDIGIDALDSFPLAAQ